MSLQLALAYGPGIKNAITTALNARGPSLSFGNGTNPNMNGALCIVLNQIGKMGPGPAKVNERLEGKQKNYQRFQFKTKKSQFHNSIHGTHLLNFSLV